VHGVNTELTFYYVSLLVVVSPLRNSGPCDSFDYLGHSKNVDDDDDDELTTEH